jgi:hypothetical protein
VYDETLSLAKRKLTTRNRTGAPKENKPPHHRQSTSLRTHNKQCPMSRPRINHACYRVPCSRASMSSHVSHVACTTLSRQHLLQIPPSQLPELSSSLPELSSSKGWGCKCTRSHVCCLGPVCGLRSAKHERLGTRWCTEPRTPKVACISSFRPFLVLFFRSLLVCFNFTGTDHSLHTHSRSSNRLVTGVLGYTCLGTCVFRLTSLNE